MSEENDSNLNEDNPDDAVSLLSNDQPSKQEISAEMTSAEVTSKPESRAQGFIAGIKTYPKDEFKALSKDEDNIVGQGGYGTVRKYRHKDKIVVIKEFDIKGDKETIKKTWNMVQCEANTLCRIRHKNIVDVLGITQWTNGVGIVLEYIDGGNLQSLLIKPKHSEPSSEYQPDLSWDVRLQIAKGITSGLEYIHNYREKKSFCHGDLKSENVLLTKSLQVKLADFGSAEFHRATGASTATTNHVSTNQYTLLYVAPEFLRDTTGEKNPAMDMYSFGMVLYELISKEEPYSDCQMRALLDERIKGGEHIRPSENLIDKAESQLTSENDRAAFKLLKSMMEKCLINDPDLRPSSKAVKMELSIYPKDAKQFSAGLKMYLMEEFEALSNKEDDVVGQGGFGTVRRYRHKDQVVVIKEFDIKGDKDAIKKTWNMVQCEANTLCRIRHKNIVDVLGITQWTNGVGIILEYIDGGNLQSLLIKHKHSEPSSDYQPDLSWNTRLQIAKGITSGLEYIHNYREKKSFCHGDLKSENVLLTKTLQVKLADFGSAEFHRATGASTATINHVSTNQYTLLYVAPEFLRDTTGAKNPAMDMYSLGMVLYELISKVEPYSDCQMRALLEERIKGGEHIRPSENLIDKAESQLTSDNDRAAFKLLKNMMERCLMNDPVLRPSSQAVKMELSTYLKDLQYPGSSTSRVRKTQRNDEKTSTRKKNTFGAPKTRKITGKQDVKESPSRSSSEQLLFGNDLPSTSSGPPALLTNSKKIEDFLETYQNVLLKKNFQEAENCLAALRSFLANDFNATAEKIRNSAIKLKNEKRHLQSVALFDTAAALFAKMKNPADDLERIQYCIQGMKQASKALNKKDRTSMLIVKEHVIPLMRNWVREMKGALQVSEKWRCHAISWALSNIEGCELMVGQMDERKQTLEEAVRQMREVFGSDVYKQQGRLFGNLVDHLAGVYNDEFRFDEAKALYEEALKAREAAEDYFGNEEDRKKDIRITTNNLGKNLQDVWKQGMTMN